MPAMDSTGSRSEVVALVTQIEQLEGRLKENLRLPGVDEKLLKQIRQPLQDYYQRLVFVDYEYATKNAIEASLWKTIFYGQIQEYRKKHSRLREVCSHPEKGERAKEALAHLLRNFCRFLDKSIAFYLDFLRKLLQACDVVLPGYSGDEPAEEMSKALKKFVFERCSRDVILISCQRCLICVGDLERYKRQYQEDNTKDWVTLDWSVSQKHYLQASRLTPSQGNPYNQLAVLATYHGDDLDGVYYYARALLCDHPFGTARPNVDLLFEKNRLKFEEIFASAEKQDLHKGAWNRKVRLTAEQRESAKMELSVKLIRPIGVLQSTRDIDSYKETHETALLCFVSWLDSDDAAPDRILKFVVVSIWSAEDLRQKAQTENGARRSGEAKDARHMALKEKAFAQSLAFCFKLIGRLCTVARSKFDQLPALGVLCSWLFFNPNTIDFDASDDKLGGGTLSDERKRAVESLVDLLNMTKSQRSTVEFTDRNAWDDACLLPEDVELLGFQPLKTALSKCEEVHRHIVGEGRVLHSAEKMRMIRLARVEALVQRLCQGHLPMVFFDSQSGHYNVEGISSHPASAGHGSQQRGRPSHAVTGSGREISTKGASRPSHSGDAPPGEMRSTSEIPGPRPRDFGRAPEPPLQGERSQLMMANVSAPSGVQGVHGDISNPAPDTSFIEHHHDTAEDDRMRDEVTFAVEVRPTDAPADFGHLSAQSMAFAATAVEPAPRMTTSTSNIAPDPMEVDQRPRQCSDVTDGYLEHLVTSTIDIGDDGPGRADGMDADDDEVEEEIILFRPLQDRQRDGDHGPDSLGLVHNETMGARLSQQTASMAVPGGALNFGPSHPNSLWAGFAAHPHNLQSSMHGAGGPALAAWDTTAAIRSSLSGPVLQNPMSPLTTSGEGLQRPMGLLDRDQTHTGFTNAEPPRSFATKNPFAAATNGFDLG